MTHVISVLNMKGGVGKTTTTVMLGEYLAAECGKKVLLVDMDPQVSLSITMLGEYQWGLVRDAGHTSVAMFRDALDSAGVPEFDITRAIYRNASNVKSVHDVDLLPLDPDIIDLDAHLAALSLAKRPSIRVWDVLHRALAPVLPSYDYVLIDCPPSMGVLTQNALRASTGYVVPTIPDVMSTNGISLLQERVEQFAEEAGTPPPDELGVIVTKHKKNSSVHTGQIARLLNHPTWPTMLTPTVPEANQIAGSAEFQQYSTLRVKYGQVHHPILSELTETFRQRVEEGE